MNTKNSPTKTRRQPDQCNPLQFVGYALCSAPINLDWEKEARHG